jgi:hypothetical protein
MLEKRRYRKISVRIWGDERFRSLSKPKPNAQTLWIYLLTGPHTNTIPGLFVSGEGSLSEALEWPLTGFRRCFTELTNCGMALGDWPHRVVWLPKAVNHNRPENPNVVKSWRTAMDEIPECHLKMVAGTALKQFIEGLGEGFAKGLGEGWPSLNFEPLANQEQEQEQEQKQEQEQEQERRTNEARASAFNEWYQDTHQRVIGIGYMGANGDWPTTRELCRKFTDAQLHDAALVWFGMNDEFATKGNRTVTKFASRITECLQLAQRIAS